MIIISDTKELGSQSQECQGPEASTSETVQSEKARFDTAVRNWWQGLVTSCRVRASETNNKPPGSLLQGFGCAEDVIVPIHRAPDCLHNEHQTSSGVAP